MGHQGRQCSLVQIRSDHINHAFLSSASIQNCVQGFFSFLFQIRLYFIRISFTLTVSQTNKKRWLTGNTWATDHTWWDSSVPASHCCCNFHLSFILDNKDQINFPNTSIHMFSSSSKLTYLTTCFTTNLHEKFIKTYAYILAPPIANMSANLYHQMPTLLEITTVTQRASLITNNLQYQCPCQSQWFLHCLVKSCCSCHKGSRSMTHQSRQKPLTNAAAGIEAQYGIR